MNSELIAKIIIREDPCGCTNPSGEHVLCCDPSLADYEGYTVRTESDCLCLQTAKKIATALQDATVSIPAGYIMVKADDYRDLLAGQHWAAFKYGISTGDAWFDGGMSDGEWLAQQLGEIGIKPVRANRFSKTEVMNGIAKLVDRAMLTASPTPPEQSGWRPIETAPTEGGEHE